MYQIKLNENNYFSYIMVSGIPSNALKTLYVAAYATAHAKCMGKNTLACRLHKQSMGIKRNEYALYADYTV